MPVCHYCNKNNLFSDVDVFQVREDIATKDFCRPSHRICENCLEEYEIKNNVTLTILKTYETKTDKLRINQRKMLRRKNWEIRRAAK